MNASAESSGGGSVVVCRKEQLREAAIVLSCVPMPDRVPLIVLEEPPVSQSEYRALFAAYRDIADARDLADGAGTGPAPGDVDAMAERLTPYRQWAKHQSFVAKMLARLAPAHAIFLFDPGTEDTQYLDPLARHRLGETQYSIVPQSAERRYLLPHAAVPAGVAGAAATRTYATLSELSDLAWTTLRGSDTPCATPIEIAESETADYFTGLYRAMQRDVALRPMALGATVRSGYAVSGELRGGGFCDPTSQTPSEAVIIECVDDAERLIGVQYARRNEARLMVIGEPDGVPIEAARAAVERRSASTLPAGLTQEQIVAAVRASLFSDDASAELLALENAVSAALPLLAIEAVGDLPLTALTTSTPYHFARASGVSWAEKPIGHIAGDISLLLLTDLFPAAGDAGVGFNLLFDPGYISTTETSDVLSDLRAGSSYSLLLAGLAGATLALTYLAPTLPIELLFFNTHGSGNGIKLADMPIPLPAYKLVQRTTITGRPIVFNNSCLSWVGVGREFLRAGARGYIGTLWSVHDAQAAEYAKNVIARMVHSNARVSIAMRDTGVSAVDARAYIFIGTATARLRQETPGTAGDDESRLLRAGSFMLHALDGLLIEAAGSLSNPYVSAIADVLLAAAETVLRSHDDTMLLPSGERVDDALMQMRIYAAFVERDENAALRANEFFVRWIATLKSLPDATARGTATARLLLYASRIPARIGPWRQGVAALEQSIAAALGARSTPLQQYLELCDAYLAGGLHLQAGAQLDSATRAYTEYGMSRDYELLGRQARVALSRGDAYGALRLAQEAFAVADASDDLRIRASAKIDEASALLASDEKERALVPAQMADHFARLAYDDELQLRASEVLARALLQNERLLEARDIAKRSLDRAKQSRSTLSIAAQAEVSGDIAMRLKEPVQAIVAWCGAAWMYVKVGRPVFEARLLQKVRVATLDLGTSNVAIQYLRLCLGVVDDLEGAARAAVAQQYVQELASIVARFGIAVLRSDLDYLCREMDGIVAARGIGASEDLKFMASLTSTIILGSGAPPHSPA